MNVEKILLVLFIFSTMFATSTGAGVASNDSYNSRYNRTTCSGYFNQSRNETEDGKCDINIENCLCNDSCIDHGECVRDLKFSYSNDDIYMKRTCLQDWTDKKVEDFCLQALPLSISQIATGDPFLHTPVTSNCTKVTYSNYYCAICNDESPSEIMIWSTKVKCFPYHKIVTETFYDFNETRNFEYDFNDTQNFDYDFNDTHNFDYDFNDSQNFDYDFNDTHNFNYDFNDTQNFYLDFNITHNIYYDFNDTQNSAYDFYATENFNRDFNETYLRENLQIVNETWGVYLNKSGKPSFLACTVSHVVPSSVTSDLHYCQDYIAECSFDWTGSHHQAMCHSYTNIACDIKNYIIYKNIHCAICNFADERDIDCEKFPFPTFDYLPPTFSFSDLINFRLSYDECSIGSIRDYESEQCRPVICHKKNSKYKHGSCTKVDEDKKYLNASATGIWSLTSCDKKYFFNEAEYFFGSNEIVHINATGRTYEKDEYELFENGVYVCVPSSYSAAMAWISLFGLTLSSICLLLHLLTFAIVPDLRNLSGMNMASLCIALLVASICFIMTAFKESAITSCVELASLIYYFFFASFMWMNVMAFDIWLTVRKSTRNFQVSSGHQWKKFIFYSLYAWITPGIALAVVLSIDQVNNLTPDYLPGLGETLCWFGQRNAVLVYFAGPLAAVMSTNMIFFLMTIRKITVTSNSTTPSSQTNYYRKQLKLYVRLAILMGLSWISGIVAGSTENQYLDYLFIFLNAFQGIFILIAYTCTSKVRRALKNHEKLKAFKVSQGDMMPVSDYSTASQINNVNQDTSSCSSTAITNLEYTTTIGSHS